MDAAQIPQEIRSFLETLLQDAGITLSDADTKEKMTEELYGRLDTFITARIADQLALEDLETFVQMTEEQKSQQEIQEFLTEKIPNVQDVMSQTLVDFRNLYLEATPPPPPPPSD